MGDQRFAVIAEAARAPGTSVLSVDCFDTLLLRRVPKPADVHLLVGNRLEQSGALFRHISPQGYAKLRRLAEEESRERKVIETGSTEVTLADIHGLLAPAVGSVLPESELSSVEVAVEREFLFVNQDFARELIGLLKEIPLRVIVVSDTYFSESHLRSFLDQGPLKQVPFECVFASSDFDTGKGAHLWETVIKEMAISADEVVHIGDNEEADVNCARRTGIRAFHWPQSSERFIAVEIREGIVGREDYPSKWCDKEHGDGGITALRRRATLLQPPQANLLPNEQVAWETGAAIFGPVFTGFAQWVLEQSELLAAERLLFLMREGQLLLDFAERAIQPMDRRPSMRTAWVSREACARASIVDGTEAELQSFLERLRPPTPLQLVGSFGLDPLDIDELPELQEQFELSSERESLAASFVDLVLGRPALMEKILDRSSRRRSHLMDYIREVAGPGDGPIGLVDVGWSGSIQESLHTMFQRDPDPLEFHGLYLLAHVGSSARALRGVRLQGYLGTLGTDPFDVAAITGGAEIVELVSTCADGSLLEIGDGNEPILAPPAGDTAEQRSRELVQLGAKAYQKSWLSHHQDDESFFDTSDAGIALLTRVLKRFVSQPNHDEALAFSWWLHEENYGSEGTEQLVPPRFLPTIRHRSAEDLHWAAMSDLHWTGGAAALVDHELSDAIFLMREGTVDPGRFSSPGTGKARLTLRQMSLEPEEHELTLVRNRHGLTNCEWRLPATNAIGVVLRPADYFVVFRPDLVEVADARTSHDPKVHFRWTRGDDRAALPVESVRWVTAYAMAVDASSTLAVELSPPVTSREIRVTLAGAYLPATDVADSHLAQDPLGEIAALRQEIDDIYGTKLLRAAALPRRLYSVLRRTRPR